MTDELNKAHVAFLDAHNDIGKLVSRLSHEISMQQTREVELLAVIGELRESFSEVLRISDREHGAWDKAKQALDKTKDII